jgi:hypothetical protein
MLFLFILRCKKGERLLDLARILKKKVSEVCRQYFKFSKFRSGPPCPNEACLGATCNASGIQRPCESSSSESEKSSESGDDDKESSHQFQYPVAEDHEAVNQSERRSHVIWIDPDTFDPPYWCRAIDITAFLNDWNPESVQVLKYEGHIAMSERFHSQSGK